MNIASVKEGDLVLVDHKGRKFYAEVLGKERRTLQLRPLDRRISWRSATSREIKGIWHKSRQKSRLSPNGDGTEEVRDG